MKRAKLAASSRTNQVSAAAWLGTAALAIASYHGVDLRGIVEGATGLPFEAAVISAATSVSALVVWYRERGRVRDEQDRVTPRPE